jgi:hypothetical protein
LFTKQFNFILNWIFAYLWCEENNNIPYQPASAYATGKTNSFSEPSLEIGKVIALSTTAFCLALLLA